MRGTITVVAIALAVCAGGARADQHEPDRVRTSHGGFGAGGFFGFTGPSKGLSLGADYYPAGRFGRYGVRGETRLFVDEADETRVQSTIGIAFEAAASRPRLVLALHADVGVALLDEVTPLIGAGVESYLWLYGPVALVGSAGGILYLDGIDTVLGLGTTTQLRLAW